MEDKKIITLNTLKEYNKHKQDTLVSGTNIKTINGNSILGSGDLEITGGGDVTLDYATKEDIDSIFNTTSTPEVTE